MKKYFFYIVIACFSILLLSFNLGQTVFWDDEAMVSWFGNNFLKYERIQGFDGFNAFFYRNGTLLEYKNPPLDIIYNAFIQKYLGTGESYERCGFAFLSFFSILIFYLILQKVIQTEFFKKITFSLFVLNINFIMFSRNCRYYSLVILFGLLIYYLFIVYQESNLKIYKVFLSFLISICFIFLFFSHYSQALVWLLVCFFSFISIRNISCMLNTHFYLICSLGIAIILCIIYGYKYQILVRNDLLNEDNFIIKYLKLSIWYIHDLNRYNLMPLWGSAAILILTILKKTYWSNRIFNQLAIFSVASILLSPQDTSHSGSFDIRYILVGMFLFPLFIGTILEKLVKYYNTKKYYFAFAVFIFLNTTAFCYIPYSTPFRFPLIGLIQEKTTDYKTPWNVLKTYLNSNLKPGTKVTCIPEYQNNILLKYYSNNIKLCNVLDSNKYVSDSFIQANNLSEAYKSNTPDLVILFGDNKNLCKKHNIQLTRYSKTDTLDVYASEMEISRPELPWHRFSTVKKYNKSKDAIFIFRLE